MSRTTDTRRIYSTTRGSSHHSPFAEPSGHYESRRAQINGGPQTAPTRSHTNQREREWQSRNRDNRSHPSQYGGTQSRRSRFDVPNNGDNRSHHSQYGGTQSRRSGFDVPNDNRSQSGRHDEISSGGRDFQNSNQGSQYPTQQRQRQAVSTPAPERYRNIPGEPRSRPGAYYGGTQAGVYAVSAHPRHRNIPGERRPSGSVWGGTQSGIDPDE